MSPICSTSRFKIVSQNVNPLPSLHDSLHGRAQHGLAGHIELTEEQLTCVCHLQGHAKAIPLVGLAIITTGPVACVTPLDLSHIALDGPWLLVANAPSARR